jgi:hypothetical protein
MSEAQKAPEQIVADFEAQHGEVVHAKTPMGLVVLRPPTDAEHQRFVEQLMDDKKKNNVSFMKQLILDCRVYPDADQMAAILRRYPALVQSLADALHTIGGGGIEVHVGKSS